MRMEFEITALPCVSALVTDPAKDIGWEREWPIPVFE
jgi:hypothetical protein